MITATKIVEFDMGHRVPNHKSKCRNPHGHRYRLEVTIGGPLDEEEGSSSEGMVVDFGDIKNLMMTYVHDKLDHGFMVYSEDPLGAILDKADPTWKLITVPFIPTAENVVKWCYKALEPQLPPRIHITRVRLYETPNSWADYIPEQPYYGDKCEQGDS